LLAPIAVLVVLAIPFGIAIKDNILSSSLIIGGISLVVFVAILTWFVALGIRLSFAYFELLYSEDIEKSKSYVTRSFALTKGKVWKIIFLSAPFVLVFSIIGGIFGTIQEDLTINRIQSSLISLQSQTHEDDHKLIEKFVSGSYEDQAAFSVIEKDFIPMEKGVNRDFLVPALAYMDSSTLDPQGLWFTIFFVLLSFFLLEGGTAMVYLSVYTILPGEKKSKTA